MPAKLTCPAIGDTFSSWTFLADLRGGKWFCQCVCGAEKEVFASQVRKGLSTGCGCTRLGPVTHGCSTESGKVYRAWKNMKQRCLNELNHRYHRYGGRGVVICPEWLNDFASFAAAVGEPPSKKHTIGRFDNDGDYTKNNVGWQTPREQMNNQCRNRLITIDGITRTMAEWCRETGVNLGAASARVNRLEWDAVRAVTQPVRRKIF